MAEITPSATLYCRNLDDRVNVQDLKANLFEFFAPHGDIIGINAANSAKMRGQAFVVFREMNAAITALRKMQGKMFMGKPIALDFSRSKSDATALLDGTYRAKRKAPEPSRPTDQTMEAE